jgi:hypothetical protein
MNESKKQPAIAHVRIEENRLTLHLEIPAKWALVIFISFLIQFLPGFWQTVQVAISFVP